MYLLLLKNVFYINVILIKSFLWYYSTSIQQVFRRTLTKIKEMMKTFVWYVPSCFNLEKYRDIHYFFIANCKYISILYV